MNACTRIAGWSIAGFLVSASAGAQCMRWSSEFTSGPDTTVYALQSFDDGSGPALYVGGAFTYLLHHPGFFTSPRIARWRNHAWEPVGWGFDDIVWSLGVFDEGSGPRLFAGGFFDWPGYGLARWDGTSWSRIASPFDAQSVNVRSLCTYTDTQGPALYVGGRFGLSTYNNIARWNGNTWSQVGGGLTTTSGPNDLLIASMCVFDDGTGSALYVGGSFTHAGGVPVQAIARWNGTNWSSLAGAPPDWILKLVVFDDGTGPALFASGWPGNVLKWDGSTWTTIGSDFSIPPDSLGVFDDGSGEALYAGGGWASVGQAPLRNIARWDGSSWSGLGMGVIGRVQALTVHDDGSGPALAAGGHIYTAADVPSRRVALWRGCTDPISTVCFGDGTVRPCPCGSNGVFGHGCPNSFVSAGARLYTHGDTASDDLRLVASGLPPSAMTLFVQGSTVHSSVLAFGDGLRCTAGAQLRLQVASAQSGQSWVPDQGTPSLRTRAQAAGDPLSPGSVRYYQALYRDPAPRFCSEPTGGTFNTTNGLRVVW